MVLDRRPAAAGSCWAAHGTSRATCSRDYDARPRSTARPASASGWRATRVRSRRRFAGRSGSTPCSCNGRRIRPVDDVVFECIGGSMPTIASPLNAPSRRPRRRTLWTRLTVPFDAALWRRARARVSVHARSGRRRIRPSSSSRRETRSSCDRAATCRCDRADLIIRSGRAFLYPVYKGTYERRRTASRPAPTPERDLRIAWARDLGARHRLSRVARRTSTPRGWRSTA